MPATTTTAAPVPSATGSQPETSTSTDFSVSQADLARELGVPLTHAAPDATPEASEATEPIEENLPEADPAPETEPTTEEQPEAPAPEPAAEDTNDDAKVPEWARRRFAELTASRKQAEERASALEAEVQSLKGQPAAAPQDADSEDLSGIDSPEALTTRERQLRSAKDWALRHLEGGTLPDGKGGEIELSAEQARAILANSDRALSEAVPARRAFLLQRQESLTHSRQAYPWMYDTKQVQTQQEVARIKRAVSGKRLSDLPELDMIIGDAMVGQSVRSGLYRIVKVDPKGGVQSAPRVAPAPARAGAAPTIRPAGRQASPGKQAALARLAKSGSLDDLAAALEAS